MDDNISMEALNPSLGIENNMKYIYKITDKKDESMWSICALSPGYFQTLVGTDVCEHSLHMCHFDGP